jgi:hypothetical protein
MPKNCSTDVQAVIGYVDNVFSKKNQTEINRVKNLFGLDLLTHLDDVAGALRNNLWDWCARSVGSVAIGSPLPKAKSAIDYRSWSNLLSVL